MTNAGPSSFFARNAGRYGMAQAMGKNLCGMCGFEAMYTCRITGTRLCSRACYRAHDQTKLKGLKR